MLGLKPGQGPVALFLSLFTLGFTVWYLIQGNTEFILYVGVIIGFFGLILWTNDRVDYPQSVLWGLAIWAVLHMAGGGVKIASGKVLYSWIMIPLIDIDEYQILKYDQFVHIIGFGVATLMMYYLIRPLLKTDNSRWPSLAIVVVMAGLGVGALNEIVEFIVQVLVPESGVGGYVNTSLDLVADLIGAMIALVYLIKTETPASVQAPAASIAELPPPSES